MANILIVDDDEAILTLLESYLNAIGHKAFRATEGYSALPAFKGCKPALMILDYQMPAGSGVDVLNRVRGLEGGGAVPAIFLTAKPLREMKELVPETPLIRFLQKPIKMEELRETIEQLLLPPSAV